MPHEHDFRFGFYRGQWGAKCACGKWLYHGKVMPLHLQLARHAADVQRRLAARRKRAGGQP